MVIQNEVNLPSGATFQPKSLFSDVLNKKH